jgi:gluconate:H+ symporter, GntP family
MTLTTTSVLLAQAAAAPPASGARLVAAALIGIALIVLLITRFKLHPFLGLTIGSLVVAAIAGLPVAAAVASYTKGFGDTAAGVGTLIALGAMFGKLLADSGGADQIVDTIIGRSSTRTLPWAMALVGALIGLPMFFEIGLVLLMPVIFLVARRSGLSLIKVGIPALAGLSVMHGLVPPHPGPLVAIAALNANLGITLAFGVLIALPTVAIAGPLFARYAARWVDVPAPHLFDDERGDGGSRRTGDEADGTSGGAGSAATTVDRRTVRRPTFAVTLATVLLPVVLMMGKALADIFIPDKANPLRSVLDFLGTPLIALLLAVLAAIFTLGRGAGMDMRAIATSFEQSLAAIAGILLIVAAGGGFKQTLIDTKIGDLIAGWVQNSGISVLLLAWFVAVLIRLATGSATVATVTASGILAPLVTTLDPAQTSLLVLAIGAGSLFFSHVNDAGFWLVKEYFGLTVGQTIKTWSIMETLISVVGLVFVLLLSLVV